MKLSQEQVDVLTDYFSDLSKILVASAVVGYFIPTNDQQISLPIFLNGSATALLCVILSVKLARQDAKFHQ